MCIRDSIGAVPQHGIHEHADTCRRFEHTGGADAVLCQHVRDGVGYLLSLIHISLLELRRLLFEPFGEAVSYLVNLGVGELYSCLLYTSRCV